MKMIARNLLGFILMVSIVFPVYAADSNVESIIEAIHDQFMGGVLRETVTPAEQNGRYDGIGFYGLYSNDSITYTFDDFHLTNDMNVINGSFVMDRMGEVSSDDFEVSIEGVVYRLSFEANLVSMSIKKESISRVR